MTFVDFVTPIPSDWLNNVNQFVNHPPSGSGYINVLSFGADPTGAHDSTAAIQNAINTAQIGSVGGTVYFPRGKYTVSGTLSNDRSANSALQVVNFVGDGSTATQINYTGTGTLFSLTGNANSASFYGNVSGMTLLATGISGTFGIGATLCSFYEYSDLHMEGWDYAFYGQDIDHSLFRKCTFFFNKQAWFARENPSPVASSTQPNQLTFIQCLWGSNSTYGTFLDQGAANTFVGCQWENNGIGNPTGFGLQVLNPSWQGGPAIILEGCYFESNNGLADLVLINILAQLNPPIADATYLINGTSFNRARSTWGAPNSVLTNFGPSSVVGQQIVVMNACTFKDFNSYVPSPSNPYINFSGAQGQTKNNFITIGNIYQNALEAPAVPPQNPAMCFLEVGNNSNQTAANGTLTTWAATNVTAGFSWVSSLVGNDVIIPETGCYTIGGQLTFTGSLANTTTLYIMVNGVPIATGQALNSQTVSINTTIRLAVGAAVHLAVLQNSGGTATIQNSASAFSYLTLSKLVDSY